MNRVKDKVCIVTGAASGMGKAHARQLAREGAKVVLTDLNEQSGRAVAEEIGASALFLRHDVSNEQDWQRVMAATTDHFGGLDVLVNNAGLMKMGTIVECTLAD
ncbi:MAG TPA: SDR family NAD(P)-dependent oxidoreductase, partial [Spongiibacteraceae bacterium]|nr:SDR family NAD(P)-dependent oxidoreductase [Spongiibacteraceae bacterium]